MDRFKKRPAAAAAAALCIAVSAVTVFAADIDLERNGSIDVAIHAYASDVTVSGGTLDLYRIADAYFSETEGYGFAYTSDFAGCDELLLTDEGLGLADTADVFAAWIKETDVQAYTSVTVDAEGKAYFADLPCGLYFIAQGTAAEGYNAINPFLVTVPVFENGTWVYSVDATPKTSPVTKVEEPKKENPPDTKNPAGSTGNNPGSSTSLTGRTKTGDIMPIAGLTIAAAAAAVAIIAAVIRRRKMRRT